MRNSIKRKYNKAPTEVTELKNTTPELKNTIKGFNSRLDEVEERLVNSKTGQWNSSNQSSKKKK